MELISLLLSVGRLQLHMSLTFAERQEQDPPAGPMPHLEPIDELGGDGDAEARLGFR